MEDITCVQCNNVIATIFKTPKGTVVCDNPECPNYGLIAICQEDMPKT